MILAAGEVEEVLVDVGAAVRADLESATGVYQAKVRSTTERSRAHVAMNYATNNLHVISKAGSTSRCSRSESQHSQFVMNRPSETACAASVLNMSPI